MNEKTIWDFLYNKIRNPYGVAGLMGNLYAESGLNPHNLQNTYEKKLGMDDEAYTKAVDDGSYMNFVHDNAGYGLAQWTYWSRKNRLYNTAVKYGTSIGDLQTQLDVLWTELQLYSAVLNVLLNAKSVREASDKVLVSFERPANQSDSVKEKREKYGLRFYEQFMKPEAAAAVSLTIADEIDEWTETKGETHMGYDRNKVINIALAEEGYLEKKSASQLDDKTANAGSNNYTKYARDMDAIPGFYNGKKQGVAWCDIFVDWCFVQAYGVDEGRALLCQPLKSSGAGCKYSRNYFKSKGRLFDKPEPGDQIFFYPKDGIGGSAIAHTGLVYKVDGSKVYTVEGNTSSASGVVANGGCVRKKSYALTYNRIAGYGRPNYGTYADKLIPSVTQPEPDESDAKGKTVQVTGSSVNLRLGPGTEFEQAALVYKGALLEWVATAENGWHGVVYKKRVLWISGKYSIFRDFTATEENSSGD